MSGILPDSKLLAGAAEKIRDEAVMLAARDVANLCAKHAVALHEMGAIETDIFEGSAATFRALERSAADKIGVAIS